MFRDVGLVVTAAGVSYAEILYRRGQADVPLPFVPGIEVAGHLRAFGPGVAGTGLRTGQPVAAPAIVGGVGSQLGRAALRATKGAR